MNTPTQQQKTLAIAKYIFGEDNVKISLGDTRDGSSNNIVYFKNGVATNFNPYKDGNDSQKVQDFFRLNAAWSIKRKWDSYNNYASILANNSDLKTAIADCAYQVIMESEK